LAIRETLGAEPCSAFGGLWAAIEDACRLLEQEIGHAKQAFRPVNPPATLTDRIISNKPTVAMFAANAPAEVFDADSDRPAANGTLLQEIRRTDHFARIPLP